MRLRSATVRSYRVHRETHVDFGGDLVLVSGPNESGKSTLAEAMHRALFLRAKVVGEQPQAMRSRHGGDPEVSLAFEAAGRECSLRKVFRGASGTVLLQVAGEPDRTADDAEERLAELLRSDETIGGKGAEKKLGERWAHLWVWQGTSGRDPWASAGEQHAALARRLRDSGGAGALQSTTDEHLARQFRGIAATLFTDRGDLKVGTEAAQAAKTAAELRARADEAAARVQLLDDAIRAHDAAEDEAARVAHQEGESEAALRQTLASLARCEALAREIEAARARLAPAEAEITRLEDAGRTLATAQASHASAEQSLAPTRAQAARAEAARGAAAAAQREAESAWRAAVEEHRAAVRWRDALRAHATVEASARQLAAAEERAALVGAHRAEIAECDARLAELPVLDAKAVAALDRLEREAALAAQGLEALGVRVECVRGPSPVEVAGTILPPGSSRTITDEAELRVGDHVLRLRPGAGSDLAAARRHAAELQAKWEARLGALGLTDLPAAHAALAQRQGIEAQRKAALGVITAQRAEALDDEVASLRRALGEARARAASLPMPAGGSVSLEEAETLERAADQRAQAADRAMAAAARQLQAAEEAARAAAARAADGESALASARAAVATLEQMHGDAAERATRRAKAQAARDLMAADIARLEKSLAALRPELLEADRRRLERSLATARDGLGRARLAREHAVGQLALSGGTDPRGEARIAAQRAEPAARHAASLRRQALACRRLAECFEEEMRRVADHVTRPLAEAAERYLACIFGAGTRVSFAYREGIFEGLEIERPGVAGGALDFGALSGGAKEQVGVALRLAVAEVLAADHGGTLPVVLDDAFANADPGRARELQRMLWLAHERGLQVIVLTCQPAAYAGLGAASVSLAQEAAGIEDRGSWPKLRQIQSVLATVLAPPRSTIFYPRSSFPIYAAAPSFSARLAADWPRRGLGRRGGAMVARVECQSLP